MVDYTQFEDYDTLRQFTIQTVDGVVNRKDADKYIRDRMPKESYFQTKILQWIRKNVPDAFAWKAAAGPYTRQGIPDICCIYRGRFYGFEVKRPFIGKASAIQLQTISRIRAAGGTAEIVTSEKEVAAILLPGGDYGKTNQSADRAGATADKQGTGNGQREPTDTE